MKLLLITTILTLTISLAAQEKFISIISNPADTTYRIMETSVLNGDTVATRTVTRWLKQNALLESMYFLARQAEATKEQKEAEAAQAGRERNYYVSTLDTLLGAGTYLNAIKSETQKALQGNWKLVEVSEGKANQSFTLVIEGDKVSGAKEGTLEAQNARAAKLDVKDLSIVMNVVSENALAGTSGDKTYYLIK